MPCQVLSKKLWLPPHVESGDFFDDRRGVWHGYQEISEIIVTRGLAFLPTGGLIVLANFNIKCEAIRVLSDAGICSGSAKCRTGETYVLGLRTPEPNGMCARAFHSVHPTAFAMRCTDRISLEKADGSVEVTCPGGSVVYRLSRIRER